MSRRAGTPTAKKVTQLVNVEEHVEGFRQVREAHRRELIDDYVELISDLIREVGEARQVDMAARLGVSQPTVAKMLKRLATMGLIEMIPWRGVFLTAEGEKLAQESRERHQIVENFLLVLGVSPDDLKAQSANDEQPDPTMEQAFIQLIHDWDKEHSNE